MACILHREWPVSYTHLDVYKRQVYMGNVYALPNQQIVEETCNVENGYVDFGNTREGVEKKIQELHKPVSYTHLMEQVAKIEKHHEERYLKLLENVKNGKVFEKEEPTVWI